MSAQLVRRYCLAFGIALALGLVSGHVYDAVFAQQTSYTIEFLADCTGDTPFERGSAMLENTHDSNQVSYYQEWTYIRNGTSNVERIPPTGTHVLAPNLSTVLTFESLQAEDDIQNLRIVITSGASHSAAYFISNDCLVDSGGGGVEGGVLEFSKKCTSTTPYELARTAINNVTNNPATSIIVDYAWRLSDGQEVRQTTTIAENASESLLSCTSVTSSLDIEMVVIYSVTPQQAQGDPDDPLFEFDAGSFENLCLSTSCGQAAGGITCTQAWPTNVVVGSGQYEKAFKTLLRGTQRGTTMLTAHWKYTTPGGLELSIPACVERFQPAGSGMPGQCGAITTGANTTHIYFRDIDLRQYQCDTSGYDLKRLCVNVQEGLPVRFGGGGNRPVTCP